MIQESKSRNMNTKHCKDCRHFKLSDISVESVPTGICTRPFLGRPINDLCSIQRSDREDHPTVGTCGRWGGFFEPKSEPAIGVKP